MPQKTHRFYTERFSKRLKLINKSVNTDAFTATFSSCAPTPGLVIQHNGKI
jgi:hypothetical protein